MHDAGFTMPGSPLLETFHSFVYMIIFVFLQSFQKFSQSERAEDIEKYLDWEDVWLISWAAESALWS